MSSTKRSPATTSFSHSGTWYNSVKLVGPARDEARKKKRKTSILPHVRDERGENEGRNEVIWAMRIMENLMNMEIYNCKFLENKVVTNR